MVGGIARRHLSTDCDMEGATDRWLRAEVRKRTGVRASDRRRRCELTDVRTAARRRTSGRVNISRQLG